MKNVHKYHFSQIFPNNNKILYPMYLSYYHSFNQYQAISIYHHFHMFIHLNQNHQYLSHFYYYHIIYQPFDHPDFHQISIHIVIFQVDNLVPYTYLIHSITNSVEISHQYLTLNFVKPYLE